MPLKKRLEPLVSELILQDAGAAEQVFRQGQKAVAHSGAHRQSEAAFGHVDQVARQIAISHFAQRAF